MRSAGWPAGTWAWWIGLLVAAQVADLATTAASLSIGGLEANPVVLGIVAGGGFPGFVLVKLIAVVLVVALLSLAGWLRGWLPDKLAHRVFRILIRGLQVAVGIQVLAALANLVVLGGLVQA